MKYRFATLVLLTALASCMSRPAAPSEYFDEQSANTWRVVSSPLVFARDRSDVAAHAHDYATLVAAEIDAAGDYSQYVLLYRWSTVDPRMVPPPMLNAGKLRITADGRVIELTPLDRLPISLAQRRLLLVPNHGEVTARAYKVDAETLRFIAASRRIKARLSQEALDRPFELREDGRGALREFLMQGAAP